MARKKSAFKEKLLSKYRLVILNDSSFEEKVSFNLTRLNVFIVFGFSSIALIFLTAILITFTPLREYIPGYSSTALQKEVYQLTIKTDSLSEVLLNNKMQLHSIRRVLTGDVLPKETSIDTLVENTAPPSFSPVSTTKEDSLLRKEVALEDKYNLLEREINTQNIVLFPPIKGVISQGFSQEKKHFAVDIVATKGTPVKAVADGRVIFAEWTAATGFVIILEHKNAMLSVYKHNASINKQQGDFVIKGEVICLSGASGELSTGPHLHFELWSNGYALDPTNFIAF